MEEELIYRLEISFGDFLNSGEEFTIEHLKDEVCFSDIACNVLLKIHNFIQGKIKGGLAIDTGKKEKGGLFTVYVKV